MYESIRIGRFVFGSTVPFYPTGLGGYNGRRSPSVDTEIFSCTESNAYTVGYANVFGDITEFVIG